MDRRRHLGVKHGVLRRQARRGAAREAVGEGGHGVVVLEPFCERGAGDRVSGSNRRQDGPEIGQARAGERIDRVPDQRPAFREIAEILQRDDFRQDFFGGGGGSGGGAQGQEF